MIKRSPPQEAGFSAKRLDRITDVMAGYVSRGDLPGVITLVERKGKTVHLQKCGWRDLAGKKPLEYNTLFRIYSMTKPVTSVALLMLLEQAHFQLNDPVHKYLPEFKGVQVMVDDDKLQDPKTDPTIHHLLTHTAGLSYGVFLDSPVDKLYQQAKLFEQDYTLEEMVKVIASLPLCCHPGELWRYSVATDVVGRLIEVLTEMSLAEYFQERIFTPLGMADTAFSVPPEKIERFSNCYWETEEDKMALQDPAEASTYLDVKLFSGGGGLVSTLADYLKFARMLRNHGELDGVRLLGRKTMELMTCNHLPVSLLPMRNLQTMPGRGFGLGVGVLLNPAEYEALGSAGSFSWSGLASTVFWVDPLEDLIAILMTQYIAMEPKSLHHDFRNLVYQALVD